MKTKIILLLKFFVVFSEVIHAAETGDSTRIYFAQSFAELKQMMEGKQKPDFERAVFISENPYHNNKYTYSNFQRSIDFHLYFIENLAAANDYSDTMNYIPKVKANGRFNIDEILVSPEKKKELYKNALNNWAIFTYMNDTTSIYPLVHLPFSYASSDPFGMENWNNSQLLNLFSSAKQEGNCYALTAFFKIMADRLKTDALLATAPQHIYIQHKDNKGDYYNVELATAGHPGDGMLQTLTYTTSTAVANGISLRSYDDRQSIGLCMVNLAKAYEHKFNTKDDDFLLQCAEAVLQNDSLNLNALLLKQQVLNERMLKIMSKNKTVFLSKLTNEQTFKELEKHLTRLHQLGYIQMPMDVQEMVLNGFQAKEGAALVDRNPKPFTIEGVSEEDNKYLTLTGGLFQEVFEPKKFEEYGQFTFDTETKTIAAIDTTKKNIALIDPVAFAYDFGARMYDARLGRFLSIDPRGSELSAWSPYTFALNSPTIIIDPDGEYPKVVITNNITGYTISRVYGTGAGSKESPTVIIVPTYEMIVYDVNEKGIATKIGSFNVTRDGWYSVSADASTLLLENHSTDPIAGSEISENVDMTYKKSNKYGKNDAVWTLPELWAAPYPDDFVKTGDSELDRIKSPDGKSMKAKGAQLHIGGFYLSNQNKLAVGGTYGCFGIVDEQQIFSTEDAAKKGLLMNAALPLTVAGIISNNEVQSFEKTVESARDAAGPMKDKMKVNVQDRNVDYSQRKTTPR